MKLDGKRIIITGGTSGIGLELVKQLCNNNEVIVISRSKNLAEEIPSTAAPVLVYQVDLGNRLELEAAADKILRNYNSIDVLINNAAIQNTPELLSDDFNYDGIQREIDINFTSICQLTYLMMPLLNKTNSSVILNVNSGLALSPKRSSAVYCATKGALNVFSQSLQYQLAESTIAVHQAFLPLVETAMTEGRGRGKLASVDVAHQLIDGIERNKVQNDIGRVQLLRLIMRIAPSIARRIMKSS